MSGARRTTRAHQLLTADLAEGGHCPVCGHADTLLAPLCSEGHGGDCPDRLCVDCGSALFIGPVLGLSLAQSA